MQILKYLNGNSWLDNEKKHHLLVFIHDARRKMESRMHQCTASERIERTESSPVLIMSNVTDIFINVSWFTPRGTSISRKWSSYSTGSLRMSFTMTRKSTFSEVTGIAFQGMSERYTEENGDGEVCWFVTRTPISFNIHACTRMTQRKHHSL